MRSLLFDSTTIELWGGDNYDRAGNIMAEFKNELDVIKGGPEGTNPVDFSRLMITFELKNTTIGDAGSVRSLMMSNHILAVIFWSNYAMAGPGSTDGSNEKIACLVNEICN